MKKTKMLKKNYEFKKVLKNGKCYGGKQINIFVLKVEKPVNLLGIAVSKKTGNSVYRNKIKRLIRENYRLLEDNIKIGNAIVILWNRKEERQEADFNIIKKDMQKSLEKAKILEKGI